MSEARNIQQRLKLQIWRLRKREGEVIRNIPPKEQNVNWCFVSLARNITNACLLGQDSIKSDFTPRKSSDNLVSTKNPSRLGGFPKKISKVLGWATKVAFQSLENQKIFPHCKNARIPKNPIPPMKKGNFQTPHSFGVNTEICQLSDMKDVATPCENNAIIKLPMMLACVFIWDLKKTRRALLFSS